jgi:hypothetical protein
MAKLRTRDGLAELQSTVWIVHGTLDPIETLASCGHAARDDGFTLRLRGARGAPIESRYHFVADGTHAHELSFTWRHDDGAPLPSMNGTVASRRIGPLLIISIHAYYACGLELPERLFFEAVGCKLADGAFAALRRALVHLLQHLPPVEIH